MVMLTTSFVFEHLTHSHGSYSEHTGFPRAGAPPQATFLSDEKLLLFWCGVPGFP